ncbi:MAG: glycosyltransferase family 4 protein [Bacteroidales bacterium]|nr:glycosyltransferase family 4 protein [Bacteroidales bacterium]
MKQCKSLAKRGYDVTLLVNDSLEDEIIDGVQIVSTCFTPTNRFERMILSRKYIRKKAIEINADIYHLHDPDLLALALHLKKNKKNVVFDSHEDYVLAINEKTWIPKIIRPLVKYLYKVYEKHIIKKIDGAVVCYHWTEERYRGYLDKVRMILNFPVVKDEILLRETDHTKRAVSFAGGISSQWCHKEILQAIGKLDNVRYELAGKLKGKYGEDLQLMEEWKKVNYHGVISYEEVLDKVYSNSSIGMALLDYISQCKGGVGNLSNTKFFEYMYMGLPLVCTDFVLWEEIITEEKCGICVNPHDIEEISKAIHYLLSNPQNAEKMGENGRKAVISKYNWQSQEIKLFELYDELV